MLRSSLRNLFQRPVTTAYPNVQADLPQSNRGRVMWEMSKCIYCRRCERVCPTNAISTNKEAKSQTIVRNRCITCNACVEVCPTQTISMVADYSKPDLAPTVHIFSANLPDYNFRVEHLPRGSGSRRPDEVTND